MIRQQNAHRHVRAITGADAADGLVIRGEGSNFIVYPII
jgi:hypothetical protein